MAQITLLLAGFLVVIIAMVAIIRRYLDIETDRALWNRLAALQPSSPATFSTEMIKGLPDSAQRYFLYSIRIGTPLNTVADISMVGRFSLGTKQAPNYMDMKAQQILAAPYGFVWKLKASKGLIRISGSDAAEQDVSWSRFWLNGFVPVARSGGDEDHARAAYGRYIAESLFWTPAALLPRDGIRWQAVDKNTARVVVTQHNLTQSADVTVDDKGRAVKVSFPRWSDANLEKSFQLQPFGGYLSKFRWFDGFRLPTHIEAGNFFETEDYFAFFIADVIAIKFPKGSAG